jgi:amino acid transporter
VTNQKRNNQLNGIASLYDKKQLKTSFSNYLYIIGGIELLILVFTFVGSVGLAKTPFPWKPYFFAAFAIPVIITFLLGIIILAFNYFYFGDNHNIYGEPGEQDGYQSSKSYGLKVNPLISQLRRIPFMVTLFALITGSIVAYKLDDIMVVAINTSEQLLKYFLVSLGVIVLMATIVGIAWVIVNYKIRKKHMEHQNHFKHEAMKQLGIILMDDNTAIDKNNTLIAPSKPDSLIENKKKKRSLMILPPAK